ncbi:hypothetical protein TRVL_09099 [Trypanosoma vivax]|nr:hypothetical protein TRVL_09099 [Trypanosoma vivax]
MMITAAAVCAFILGRKLTIKSVWVHSLSPIHHFKQWVLVELRDETNEYVQVREAQRMNSEKRYHCLVKFGEVRCEGLNSVLRLPFTEVASQGGKVTYVNENR